MTYGSCQSRCESNVHTWLEAVRLGQLGELDGAPGRRIGLQHYSEIHAEALRRRPSRLRYWLRPRLRNLPSPLAPRYSAVVDDDLCREDMHRVDVAVDLEALPRGVVHVHVVGLARPDRGVAVRVVDHDVGVGTGLDDALAAVQAEHPRRRGRGELDPARQRDLAGHDALVHAGPCGARSQPMPFGILRKSPSPSSFWSFMQNGQWSVETICRSFVRSACHM